MCCLKIGDSWENSPPLMVLSCTVGEKSEKRDIKGGMWRDVVNGEGAHIHTCQALWQTVILPSPGSGEIVAFVSVREAALEESKSALCFYVPLPNLSPSVH